MLLLLLLLHAPGEFFTWGFAFRVGAGLLQMLQQQPVHTEERTSTHCLSEFRA